MICGKDTFAKNRLYIPNKLLFSEMSDYAIGLIYSHYKPW